MLQERGGSATRGQRAARRFAARDHGGRRGGDVGERQTVGRAHDRPGRGRRRGPGVRVLVHVRGTGAVRLQQGHAAGRTGRRDSCGRSRRGVQQSADRTARSVDEKSVDIERRRSQPSFHAVCACVRHFSARRRASKYVRRRRARP